MVFGPVALHLGAYNLMHLGHFIDRHSTLLPKEVENRLLEVCCYEAFDKTMKLTSPSQDGSSH